MDFKEKLNNVAVLGAAGKMGSGITLLAALEMAQQSLLPENKDKTYSLHAIDVSESALNGLLSYIRMQATKSAEKIVVGLRKTYAERHDLIENEDIVRAYVDRVLDMVKPSTRLEATYDSELIFEAIKEDVQVKAKVFAQIKENHSGTPWFLTNTSSIPIQKLNDEANLNGNIIGFHFYNPPAIQKLVEIIPAKSTSEELIDFANSFAKSMRKVIVNSNDIAGFIGNGFFMRDIITAERFVNELAQKYSITQAIFAVDTITRDYLIRPMGIFQLSDYVGLDVCSFIMHVMNPHFKDENIECKLINKYLLQEIKGGQKSSGAQKGGIFKYEKGKITDVFDLEKKKYLNVAELEEWFKDEMGVFPLAQSWKEVIRIKQKDDVLKSHFSSLASMEKFAGVLALEYGGEMVELGKKLVEQGVANNVDDVNTVMLTGFFHAYGPINSFF